MESQINDQLKKCDISHIFKKCAILVQIFRMTETSLYIKKKIALPIIALIYFFLFFSGGTKNNEIIVREFVGNNISVEGVSIIPTEIQGQLFYSKKQGGLITANYSSFKEDKTLLTVCPLIRIYKDSESGLGNLKLSITFQTVEFVEGKEKRISFRSMFDRNLNITKVVNNIGKEERYIIIDGDENKVVEPYEILKIEHYNSGLTITYIDKMIGGLYAYKYKMTGIKVIH